MNNEDDPVKGLLKELAMKGSISPAAAGLTGDAVMPAMPQEEQPASTSLPQAMPLAEREVIEPTNIEDYEIEEQEIGGEEAAPKTLATFPEINDELIESVSFVESQNIWDAESESGAVGIMQIKPKFAVDPGYGAKNIFDVAEGMGVDTTNISRDEAGAKSLLLNPEVNVAYGSQYLQAMYDRFGDVEKALIAYNWGPADTGKWVKEGADFDKLPAKVIRYLDKIERTLNGENVYGPSAD